MGSSFFIFDTLHNDSFSSLDKEGKMLLQSSISNFHLFFRDHLSLPSSLSFGLEFEFVLLVLQVVSDYLIKYNNWHVLEEERNIITFLKNGGKYGGEVTTPKCFDQTIFWKEIQDVLIFLKKNGADINEFCGGHIHIGKNILEDNTLYLERLIKLWIVFEDVIFRFGNQLASHGRSYQAHAARICGPALYTYLDYHNKTLHTKHFFREMKHFKLSSLSFQDFEREDGTLEFRNPDGTLEVELWQTRVLFYSCLMLSVKNEKNDFEWIDYLVRKYNAENCSYQSFSQFDYDKTLLLADFIFQNNLDKAMFLKACMKDEPLIFRKGKIISS